MHESMIFVWQHICWDINVYLSLNFNGNHPIGYWMQWTLSLTLSLTLSVCVFDFGSMLVNIYLVYCILKCICHTSYYCILICIVRVFLYYAWISEFCLVIYLLVSIYLVYPILKCICHTSYIAYQFILS